MSTAPEPRQIHDEPHQDVLFDAVLYPHRSLSPRGFGLLMAGLCAISFAAGILFMLHGAWPVFGFLGLDVLAVYVAFRLNYRSGRMFETVTLTPGALTVRRVDHRGRERCWSFQPYWLRIHLEEPPGRAGHLVLASHGRSMRIGTFLSPEERAQFATQLRDALAALKGVPQPV